LQFGGNPYLNPTLKEANKALEELTNAALDNEREPIAEGDYHYYNRKENVGEGCEGKGEGA
jgi:hypothetical protein